MKNTIIYLSIFAIGLTIGLYIPDNFNNNELVSSIELVHPIESASKISEHISVEPSSNLTSELIPQNITSPDKEITSIQDTEKPIKEFKIINEVTSTKTSKDSPNTDISTLNNLQNKSVADLLKTALVQGNDDPRKKMDFLNTVVNDPAKLQQATDLLLTKITETENPKDLDQLYDILLNIPGEQANDNITNYGLELLHSDDAEERDRAYTLLSRSDTVDPNIVLENVWNEASPEMAKQAILSSLPDYKNYSSETKSQLSTMLNEIYDAHQNSTVRAAALERLSLIDSNSDAQAKIQSALYSNDLDILSAAVQGIANNKSFATETNKAQLFSIINSNNNNEDLLTNTYHTLTRSFDLNESEFNQLLELKKTLSIQY